MCAVSRQWLHWRLTRKHVREDAELLEQLLQQAQEGLL